jgi:hypothetical protein
MIGYLRFEGSQVVSACPGKVALVRSESVGSCLFCDYVAAVFFLTEKLWRVFSIVGKHFDTLGGLHEKHVGA